MTMGNLSRVSVSGEGSGAGGSGTCRGRSECSGEGCAVQTRAVRKTVASRVGEEGKSQGEEFTGNALRS